MDREKTWMIVLATLALVLGAVSASAQTGPPGDGGGTLPPDTNCPTVVVSGVENPLDMSRNRFSAVATSDLVFHVMFPQEVDREAVVTLKVYTPRGHLYRTLDVPVKPPKTQGPTGTETRRLPGYPYPVRVETPRNVSYNGRSYQTVDVSFPVAGSAIVTSSLYGRWSVEVHMNGASSPCPERTEFDIIQ